MKTSDTREISLAELENDAEARKLGDFLRRHLGAPPVLENPDFFNSQIRRKIEAERGREQKFAAATAPAFSWRLLWGGMASLGAAAVLFFALVQPELHRVGPEDGFYAQILNAQSGDVGISAVAYYAPDEKLTIVWLEGMDYLPEKPARTLK